MSSAASPVGRFSALVTCVKLPPAASPDVDAAVLVAVVPRSAQSTRAAEERHAERRQLAVDDHGRAACTPPASQLSTLPPLAWARSVRATVWPSKATSCTLPGAPAACTSAAVMAHCVGGARVDAVVAHPHDDGARRDRAGRGRRGQHLRRPSVGREAHQVVAVLVRPVEAAPLGAAIPRGVPASVAPAASTVGTQPPSAHGLSQPG